MAEGYIMQVQNFCVNDGEGIRTVVFLSGCPLRCLWCANPEGQTIENVMTTHTTTEEVMKQIKKQMIFYRHSGGGVTFSGGEATVQETFLRELTEASYDMGIDLAIETCGQFAFEQVEDILRKMNCIFFDVKHIDKEEHLKYTGMSNECILENIKKVAALGVPLVVRIPVICGVNAKEEVLTGIFAYIAEHAKKAQVELLPYHTLGEYKYETLGIDRKENPYLRPSEGEMARWNQLAEDMGICTVSYV